MIAGTATAKNVLLQDAPSRPVADPRSSSTSRPSSTRASRPGSSSGSSENPNTFAKITYISRAPSPQYEWVATRNAHGHDPAGPQISTPDGDICAVSANGVRHLHRRGLDRRRGLAADRRRDHGPRRPGDAEVRPQGLRQRRLRQLRARSTEFRVDCSDRVPPATTRDASPPEQPDGKLGWYKTPPTVTLTADDGALGAGRPRSRYRIDGGALQHLRRRRSRSTEPGEHVVEYFATDSAAEPNVEEPKTARVPRRRRGAGDRRRRHAGDGGHRSGAGDARRARRRRRLRHRADAVPRRRRPVDDLLAPRTSRSSTARRRRSRSGRRRGAGRFDLLDDGSGGITPVGGLGMLWYPVKPYGDFRLKFQFREGADGRRALQRRRVRPLPGPARPGRPAADACSKTGSAANDEAWVAIYCGHEIQLYDGRPATSARPARSTTFDNNDLEQIGEPKRRGEWEDYEVEVVGQDYTICRNGELINSSRTRRASTPTRAGDPPTQLRQFAQRLHRPPEPRRRGRDAVPQHPRRGPVAGRARAQTRAGRSRSRARVRTRSRSARSTRPATRRRSSRSTSRSAQAAPAHGPVGRPAGRRR